MPLSALASPYVGDIGEGLGFSGVALRVAISAVIGGTAAELGGGKFANGAISAAFMRLYNDEHLLQRGKSRGLTEGEIALAKSVYGDEIDYSTVRISRTVGIWGQPANRAMSLRGKIYFHPDHPGYVDDFSKARIALQADFIHELTHVWQHQNGRSLVAGKMFRGGYEYLAKPDRPFGRYGIEQQAAIVEHYFLISTGHGRPGVNYRPLDWYRNVIPFGK